MLKKIKKSKIDSFFVKTRKSNSATSFTQTHRCFTAIDFHELSEDLKNFQLLELLYYFRNTAMSAADAMPSSTADQPITQSVEQTWLTRTLAEGDRGRCENLKLGWRTTQLFRGFTILGFSFENGPKTRPKHLAKSTLAPLQV